MRLIGGPNWTGSTCWPRRESIPLFESISSQLGLKLETGKRPEPVLVVDRIERKPLEN